MFTYEDIPRSITEDILKYLEEQDLLQVDETEGGHDYDIGYVRALIEQVIDKIVQRADHIEEFDRKSKAHNQYPLFDFKKIIPDFELVDDLYEQIVFRETLVVSSFDSSPNRFTPNVVGGLCLDVQAARGKNPFRRKHTGLNQSLIELITNIEMNRRKGLKTVSQQELDRFVVCLKPRYERNNCKFLVHLSSQFVVDGKQAGSRITTWVDRNFHTLLL